MSEEVGTSNFPSSHSFEKNQMARDQNPSKLPRGLEMNLFASNLKRADERGQKPNREIEAAPSSSNLLLPVALQVQPRREKSVSTTL
jgi:hypothetical protein